MAAVVYRSYIEILALANAIESIVLIELKELMH